jgi:hypothetical protein
VNKTKATFLGLLIWIVITIIYSKVDAAPHGSDLIGFPFYFLSLSAGKSAVVAVGLGFNLDFAHLILDVILAIAFVLLLNIILLKIFKPSKTKF